MIQAGFFQVDAHKGARFVAQILRADNEFGTCDDADVGEPLHPLVYGCSRHTALACHFKKRCACVFRDYRQNLLVKFVDVVVFAHS